MCDINSYWAEGRSFFSNKDDPSPEQIRDTPDPDDGLQYHVPHILMRIRIREYNTPLFIKTWVTFWDFKEENNPSNFDKDHEISFLANHMADQLFWQLQDVRDFQQYLIQEYGTDRIVDQDPEPQTLAQQLQNILLGQVLNSPLPDMDMGFQTSGPYDDNDDSNQQQEGSENQNQAEVFGPNPDSNPDQHAMILQGEATPI